MRPVLQLPPLPSYCIHLFKPLEWWIRGGMSSLDSLEILDGGEDKSFWQDRPRKVSKQAESTSCVLQTNHPSASQMSISCINIQYIWLHKLSYNRSPFVMAGKIRVKLHMMVESQAWTSKCVTGGIKRSQRRDSNELWPRCLGRVEVN